jgi:hypothetical protein
LGEGFIDGFIEDDVCPDIMLDDEALGDGEGVPIPSARAGATARAARTRASAYVFTENLQ